jgi:hypothetical protein
MCRLRTREAPVSHGMIAVRTVGLRPDTIGLDGRTRPQSLPGIVLARAAGCRGGAPRSGPWRSRASARLGPITRVEWKRSAPSATAPAVPSRHTMPLSRNSIPGCADFRTLMYKPCIAQTRMNVGPASRRTRPIRGSIASIARTRNSASQPVSGYTFSETRISPSSRRSRGSSNCGSQRPQILTGLDVAGASYVSLGCEKYVELAAEPLRFTPGRTGAPATAGLAASIPGR